MRNQSYILVARGFSAVLLCLFAALMVCGLSAVAEVPGSGLDDCIELPDNESQAAVGRAENWAKSLTTFEAKFIQESSAAALGASEQSGGELAFANPGRMRWRYEWPEKQDFLIEGQTMQLYQPSMNQLLIDSAKAVLSSELPVAFLAGVATVSEKFSLNRACYEVSEGRQGKNIRLKFSPRSKSTLRTLGLLIEETSGRVIGADIIDESDNITSFKFSRIIEGEKLSSNQFKIEVPSGTDIQDNRKKHE